MLVSSLPSLSAAALAPQTPATLAAARPVPGRGAKAAREFEAELIESLLQSLEKTFAALPGDKSIPGADEYNDLGMQALSEGLAERGGFGIAAMIARHLPGH